MEIKVKENKTIVIEKDGVRYRISSDQFSNGIKINAVDDNGSEFVIQPNVSNEIVVKTVKG